MAMERVYLRDMMPVTKKRRARKPRRRGRKAIGKVAMTAAQRQAKRRAKLRKAAPGQAIIDAWDAATPQGQKHFLTVVGLRPKRPPLMPPDTMFIPGGGSVVLWPHGREPYALILQRRLAQWRANRDRHHDQLLEQWLAAKQRAVVLRDVGTDPDDGQPALPFDKL